MTDLERLRAIARDAATAGECRVRHDGDAGARALEVRTDDGGRWLRVHGRSRPEAEARGWLDRALEGRPLPPLTVVIGVGQGWIVDEIFSRREDARVLALEVEPACLEAFLDRRDWRAALDDGRLVVASAPDYRVTPPSWPDALVDEPPLVLVHPVLEAARPLEIARARAVLRQFLFEQRANRAAARQFAALYLEHTLANLDVIAAEADVAGLDGLAAGLPLVVCGAGPSLDRTIEALGRVRDRVVLLALDTALRPLLAAGIEPDLALAVDPTPLNGRHLVGLPRTRRTWLVAEPSVDPRALRPFAGRTFIFRVARNHPWPWLIEAGATRTRLRVWGSVLTAACDLAVRTSANPIVCVGIDLAYTGGQPYCRGTAFEEDWAAHAARDGLSLDGVWATRLPGNAVAEPDVAGQATLTAPHLVAFRNWLRGFAIEQGSRRFINATGAGILYGERIEQRSLDEVAACWPALEPVQESLAARHARARDGGRALRGVAPLARLVPTDAPWTTWAVAVEAFDVERGAGLARRAVAHAQAVRAGVVSTAPDATRGEDAMQSVDWVQVPYDRQAFRAKAPLEWQVEPGQVRTYAYRLAGRTMTLSFQIENSALAGGPANELYLGLPGGYLPARSMANAVWIGNQAVKETGYATVHPGLDVLVIFRPGENAFAPDPGTTCVFGQITFEVA
jgi:hypothetical protein